MGKLKDHREIGKELDLYSFHDVAPGAIFWHNRGYLLYKKLIEVLRTHILKEGYEEISTPVMIKSDLFKKSGHWDFYQENMFVLDLEGESYSLKPMNCPESTLIYSSTKRSYQDLPIRLAEFGVLHRNELSGVLGGLFRARQFIIDDAHHFVRPDQILSEIHELLMLTVDFYKKFGFETSFYLATRPEKAMGDPKLWKEAEKDLEQALRESKVKFGMKEKEGAFYGPKIDIHIKDSQGRDWQLATIQLDFQIPEKMKLEYIDADGKSKRPVMIHRAILGSIERFIGILVEHYQGSFPFWIAPVQVAVLSVSERNRKAARTFGQALAFQGIRTELDLKDKTISNKIREATLQKIPYMVIIGDKEESAVAKALADKQKINGENLFGSVRTREGKDLGLANINEFISKLKAQIETFS